MTIIQIIHQITTGLVFTVWAYFMFRMLWRITRQSLDKQAKTGGGYFTWVGHSLRSFGEAATSERDHPERRRLIILTLVIVALIALGPIVASIGH
jgi:hypothetical protein